MANVTTKVDLVINRLSQQKYDQLSAAGLLNPNQLYVTSGGADAVLETRLVAGKALSADVTAADISSAIGLDNYLTAVPSDYKTYVQTKQSLSGDGYVIQDQLDEKSSVSVDNVRADVNMVHISLDDYSDKLVGDQILSNELYVVSADYVEAYGQQIKNVANPTDLSDAATKGYVDSNFQPSGNYLTAVPSDYKTYTATLSSLSSTYSLTSHTHNDYVLTSRTVAGQALTANVTAAAISSAIGLSGYYTKADLTGSSGVLKDYSLTSHTHNQYLTAVPSAYKTYAGTLSSLSSDGYATQAQLDTKSSISVDNEHADANILHVSQEEYNQLVVDDEVLSNVVYVISSDYIEAYGQQMKNLAPGTDLSDAVNVEQLNTVSTLANYYMKSETSSAIEISSALSSISAVLSGLEDILHEINTGSQS